MISSNSMVPYPGKILIGMDNKFKDHPPKKKGFLSCSLIIPGRRSSVLLSLIVGLFLVSTDGFLKIAYGQISQGGTPYSFSSRTKSASRTDSSTASLSQDVPVIEMPRIRPSKIDSIKKANETGKGAFQFAYGFQTDIEVKDSSVKDSLAAGMLYRTSIRSKGAFSLNLIFSKYHLPRGAKLFIYSKDQEDLIGAFTSNNNKESKVLPTIPVEGDEVVVEYFEPYHPEFEGELKIGKVSHDFMDILNTQNSRDFGSSGNCQVDINCPEGNGWQDEKRAVLKILYDGIGWCSAALLNNTNEDGTPYVLSANHCFEEENTIQDHINKSVFIFNYESPSCNGPDGSMAQSISGGTLRANRAATDFLLLELSKQPLSTYNPYFAGWDRTDDHGAGGVGIHHPKGDVKKISTYGTEPEDSDCIANVDSDVNSNQDFYQAQWISTQNGHGITEDGSSGSPLFNNNGHVIGQLYGVCDNLNCNNTSTPSQYGKLYASWNGASPSKRLRDWLNPANNVSTLSGTSGCNEGTVNLNITHPIASGSSEQHLAKNTITASNKVESGAEATYEAGEQITLKKGFHAEKGSDLHARIVQTDQNCVVTCDPINVNTWTEEACSEGKLCFNAPYAEHYEIKLEENRIVNGIPTTIQILNVSGSVNGTAACISLSSHNVDPGGYFATVSFSNDCHEVSNAYLINVQNCGKAGSSNNQESKKTLDTTREDLVEKSDKSEGWKISVHPNPNQGKFTVEVGPKIRLPYSFGLINSKGMVLHEVEKLNASRINVNKNELPAGVYYIRVIMGEEQKTKKVIVRK